ncbi:MAG: PorV/PorQ family protein [Bacteroidetes bacterium]|nr:PorV/PorQ family protein [Bacteroidota bacterium]
MVKKITLSLLFAGVATLSFGQEVRKYSNEFLSIGVGARALGMSNAFVSTVDDATSGYWNPAGLVHVQSDRQISLMHAEYFAGIAKYDYAGFAMPLDTTSSIGFSFIRFGVDDIPNTTDLIDANGNINYDRITSFSAADYAFLVSYAKKTSIPGLSLGANAKVVHRMVGSFAKAWGFGLDAGMQYRKGKWRFGAMARDVTSTFNAWSYTLDQRTIDVFNQTGNEIPVNSIEVTLPKLILGAARSFTINDKFSVLAETNAIFTFDRKRNVAIRSNFSSIEPLAGFEVGYGGFAFFRGGIGNIQRVTDYDGNPGVSIQPNMGVGVRIKGFTLDYALTDVGDQSVALYSNIFSLKFDINRRN